MSGAARRFKLLLEAAVGALLLGVLGSLPLCAAAAAAFHCPAGCSCQQSAQHVSCVGLDAIPRISSRSLRTLQITQHRITRINKSTFTGLEQLEELEITGGRLSEISSEAFSPLRQLRSVNVSHNELTVVPRDAFAQCPQLQRLDVSWNPLVLPSRSPMLASGSLSVLDISFCSLTNLPVNVFSMVPALAELRLRGNDLQPVSECILEPVKGLILLDTDRPIQWAECASQGAATSDTRHTTTKDVSATGRDFYTRLPTDDFQMHPRMFIPTLPQCIFLILAGLFLAFLLDRIRKACQPAKRREENEYTILGGTQTSQLTVPSFQDLRSSRIPSDSCEMSADYVRNSLGDGESRQYVPIHFCPTPALQCQIPLMYRNV